MGSAVSLLRTVARREALSSAALGLAACALTLLSVEGLLRAAGYVPERHKVRYRMSNKGDLSIRAGATVLDCYPTNPHGYFDVDLRLPAVRDWYATRGFDGLEAVAAEFPWAVEFEYNEEGFRDTASGPRPAGVLRIAVVGDSFTEGQGVREADAYPRVLERLLNARERAHFQVLNLGYRGRDFPELLESFEIALRYDADLVIYGMVLNDAARSEAFDRRWPRLNDWIMVRRPAVELGPLDSRLLALWRERRETQATARATTRWYKEMYGPANADGWDRTRACLREMKTRSAEKGAKLLVALWPLLVRIDADYPFLEAHETIARVCGRNGIPFLDLLDALRGRPSEALWVHPVDLHPNEVGHALAAAALVPIVDDLLPD